MRARRIEYRDDEIAHRVRAHGFLARHVRLPQRDCERGEDAEQE
jgi:hypothetical protein